MDALSVLESQLQQLSGLSKGSAKLLDNFAETFASIEARTKRIRQDVQPWETAQESITETIEEMSKASRSYKLPNFVPQVLAKRETDPLMICAAIDHLVYAQKYVEEKPSNDFSEKLLTRLTDNIQSIRNIANDVIMTAFVQATNKWMMGAGAAKDFSTPGKWSLPSKDMASSRDAFAFGGGIVRNKDALKNIDELVKKVYDSFNSKEVVERDVKQLFSDKLQTALDSMFDAAYLDEHEGIRDPSSTHINLAAVTKHYQRGDHRWIRISETCRRLVLEVSDALKTFVLTPVGDDSDVTSIPGELASMVFAAVVERADAAVRFDLSENGGATRMFVASRGAGIGLCPAGTNNGRYFRDCLFIGLDLVPELWQWKSVAEKVAGDNADFVDIVDSALDAFIERVREPLDIYADAKGTIEEELLVKLTVELSAPDWIPAFDCTAHESSTNVLYLLKVLFQEYLGSTKLVLHGGRLNSAEDDVEAVEEVEDFVSRCIRGTMDDLTSLTKAARTLQDEEESRRINIKLKNFATKTITGSSKTRCRVDEHVFLANNATYLLEHLRREPCFSQRLKPPPLTASGTSASTPRAQQADKVSASGSLQRGGSSSAKEALLQPPIVAEVITYLEEVRTDYVNDYRESWYAMFEEDPIVQSILELDVDEPLTKAQRMAVKQWYGNVSRALQARVEQGCVITVMDARVRSALVDAAVDVVEEKLSDMESLLAEREWSKQPAKWQLRTTSEWVDELQKMF